MLGGIADGEAEAIVFIIAIVDTVIETCGAGVANRHGSVESGGRWQSSQSSCTGPLGPARFFFMCTA